MSDRGTKDGFDLFVLISDSSVLLDVMIDGRCGLNELRRKMDASAVLGPLSALQKYNLVHLTAETHNLYLRRTTWGVFFFPATAYVLVIVA